FYATGRGQINWGHLVPPAHAVAEGVADPVFHVEGRIGLEIVVLENVVKVAMEAIGGLVPNNRHGSSDHRVDSLPGFFLRGHLSYHIIHKQNPATSVFAHSWFPAVSSQRGGERRQPNPPGREGRRGAFADDRLIRDSRT